MYLHAGSSEHKEPHRAGHWAVGRLGYRSGGQGQFSLIITIAERGNPFAGRQFLQRLTIILQAGILSR
jgi:hypothetical protein